MKAESIQGLIVTSALVSNSLRCLSRSNQAFELNNLAQQHLSQFQN